VPTKKQVIDGDVEVTGKVTALGGMDDPAGSRRTRALEARVARNEIESGRNAAATAVVDAATALAGIRLELSTTSVSVSRAGVYFPASITVYAKAIDGSSYYGRFIIATSPDASAWTDRYTSSADEQTHAYTFTTGVYIRVRLYEKGGIASLLREAIITVTEDVSATPLYWGPRTTAPSANFKEDDYYFDSRAAGSGGGILRYYDGDSWEEMTSAHALYFEAWNAAFDDMIAWSNVSGNTEISAVTAKIQNLIVNVAFIRYLKTLRVEFEEVVASLVKASSSLTAGDDIIYMGKDPRRPGDSSREFEFAIKEYVGNNGLPANMEEWMAHFLTKKQNSSLGAVLSLLLSGSLFACSGVYSKPGTAWYESAVGSGGASYPYSLAHNGDIWVSGETLGVIRRSEDNGATWSAPITNPLTSSDIVSMVCYGNGVFLAATDTGKIIRSTDNGATWSALITNPFGGTQISTGQYIGNAFVLAGYGGKISRSTDNGATWSALITNPFGGSYIVGSAVGNGVLGLVAADGGKISRSTDNGATWSALITNPFGSTGMACLSYGNGVWVAANSDCDIASSLDGMLSWSDLRPNPLTGTVTGAAYGDNTWVIVTNTGELAISNDAGNSWAKPILEGSTPLSSINAIGYNGSRFVIAGSGGTRRYGYSDWLGPAVVTKETAYTPTLVGFGTPTGVSFSWTRVGNRCKVTGRFASGTSTAVEARIPLPWGLTIDSALVPTIRLCGIAGINAATPVSLYVLMEPSVSYVTIGYQSSANNALTKQNANAFLSSGQIMSVDFEVPISGWNT
jgi:photosystem II stability/assembly factor-like uncharacterized protein